MSSGKIVPLPIHIAIYYLRATPYRRKYLGLFGPELYPVGGLFSAAKQAFLVSCGIGGTEPALADEAVTTWWQPRAYTESGASIEGQARELGQAAQESVETYEELFAEEIADPRVPPSATLGRDQAIHYLQIKSVLGLVIGRDYPHLARRLIESEVTEWYEATSFEEFQRFALSLAELWRQLPPAR